MILKVKYVFRVITVVFLLSVFMFSCKKEEVDNTAPEALNLQLNSSGDSLALAAGNNLEINFLATDDKALSQFRIKIYNALNGFTRNSLYEKTYVGSVEGTSSNASYSIFISDTFSSGNYEIEVSVLDVSGNESEKLYGKLYLTQTNQPQIYIGNLDEFILNQVTADTLFLNGNITDAIDLEEIYVRLKNNSAESTIYSKTFSLTDTLIQNWDFTEISTQNSYIIFPVSSIQEYELLVRAKNNSGNYTVKIFRIEK